MSENILAVLLLLICLGLMLYFGLHHRERRLRPVRSIPAVLRLRRALGLSVEDGKRLHISLGKSSLTSSNISAALVGLSTLERIAQMSMVSDRPPIATSGDPGLAILSQDTLRAAYRAGNALDQYDATRGRLAGVTPLSYTAGAIPVARDEQVSAHVLVGNLGPEAGLLLQAADQQRAFSLAASDDLPAQAVMMAAAEEPLIGEEVYALPAYLNAGPMHQASLHAQDVLRWVVIAVMVAGAILKLFGINIL